MVRVGDWVQPPDQVMSVGDGTAHQWQNAAGKGSLLPSWEDAWATAVDPDSPTYDDSRTYRPKATTLDFSPEDLPYRVNIATSTAEVAHTDRAGLGLGLSVVALSCDPPMTDIYPDEIPDGAVVEFDRSDAEWLNVRWSVAYYARALKDKVSADVSGGEFKVRLAPFEWTKRGDDLADIPRLSDLISLPVAVSIPATWEVSYSIDLDLIGPPQGTPTVIDVDATKQPSGQWRTPALVLDGPWLTSLLPKPSWSDPLSVLHMGTTSRFYVDAVTGTYRPPRYRIVYPSSGRYTLRQRQTLTGSDGWPLRQRQNGGHSGTWPLRQRQTGV